MRKERIEKFLKKYEFNVPVDQIAHYPAFPRDSARVLIYNRKTKKTAFDTFANIGAYLPPKSIIVCNDTKVIPARLSLRKQTGGLVNILFVSSNSDGSANVLANKHLRIGEILYRDNKKMCTIIEKQQNSYRIKRCGYNQNMRLVFERNGTMPLPPYIKNNIQSTQKKSKDYQTVFAKNAGSIAAPTASLHFTKKLIEKLKKEGHTICFVTLHVNLGTFAPVNQQQLDAQKLHKEYINISEKTARILNRGRQMGRTIIAVGTTAARTLESAVDQNGIITTDKNVTDLFIQEGYKYKIVDGLITNFHVPRSSLLALVSAFVGRKIVLRLYRDAIERKFRLFSFGDGMYIQ
jgi:S-adenosylmethionine:tRNA ribosyltransferase-isomerase